MLVQKLSELYSTVAKFICLTLTECACDFWVSLQRWYTGTRGTMLIGPTFST